MFVTVARLEDVPEGGGLKVQVQGRELVLFRQDGQVYALDDRCSHAEASLADGRVQDGQVVCPRHGGRFDVRTGRAVRLPAYRPVRTYPVRVEGDRVQVDVDTGG